MFFAYPKKFCVGRFSRSQNSFFIVPESQGRWIFGPTEVRSTRAEGSFRSPPIDSKWDQYGSPHSGPHGGSHGFPDSSSDSGPNGDPYVNSNGGQGCSYDVSGGLIGSPLHSAVALENFYISKQTEDDVVYLQDLFDGLYKFHEHLHGDRTVPGGIIHPFESSLPLSSHAWHPTCCSSKALAY